MDGQTSLCHDGRLEDLRGVPLLRAYTFDFSHRLFFQAFAQRRNSLHTPLVILYLHGLTVGKIEVAMISHTKPFAIASTLTLMLLSIPSLAAPNYERGRGDGCEPRVRAEDGRFVESKLIGSVKTAVVSRLDVTPSTRFHVYVSFNDPSLPLEMGWRNADLTMADANLSVAEIAALSLDPRVERIRMYTR
jgi:hypothetical protein